MSRFFCATILLVLLVGCGPKKPDLDDSRSRNTPDNSGPTVYDQRGDTDSSGASNSSYGDPEDVSVVEEDDYLQEMDLDDNTSEPMNPTDYAWEPVFFGFDNSNLTDGALAQLREYAAILRDNQGFDVLLEGHCDERGTEEYNIALGERRASRVREFLISAGVNAGRLKTISYGELRPLEPGSNETAWSRNRRVMFVFPNNFNN